MKITRRQMLGAASAAALSPAALAASSPAKPANFEGAIGPQLRLSLAGYSFREYLPDGKKPGKMTYEDLFELAAGWGIDAVEPTSYYFSSEDNAYLHALKAKAFKLGLDISGTAIRNNFCLPAGPELDAELAHTRKWIDHAVELGAPVIRIFAGNKVRDLDDEAALENAIAGMKIACDYAGERGVFLAIENHGYLTRSADVLLRIIEAVNHPWLGINLDTGNFEDAPYENIARALPHAINVQVKVMITDQGKRGPADFARIVSLMREANYRGYLVLEYEEKEDPMTAVPKCLDALRTCV